MGLEPLEDGFALGSGGFQFGQLAGIDAGSLGLKGAGQLAGEGLAFLRQAGVVAATEFGVDLASQLGGEGDLDREGVLAGRAEDRVFSFHLCSVVVLIGLLLDVSSLG